MKKVWAVELDLLYEYQRVCEKYGLKYWACDGTLLGAVRHKGFIPWDDDIDVIMFRKEFDKLNEILKYELDEKYNFINVLNEETYHYTWARLTLKNTLFKEWWGDQVDYTPNIFIDIFILHNIPNNRIKRCIRWGISTLTGTRSFNISMKQRRHILSRAIPSFPLIRRRKRM